MTDGASAMPREIPVGVGAPLTALLLAGTLVIDLLTPMGIAAPVLYLIPVILAAWAPRPAHGYLVAGIATVLTTLGIVATPPGGDLRAGLLNRALALAVVWIGAVLVAHLRRVSESLRESRRQLELVEARLREQAALARLGEMAAVVAHEVKNPLTGIAGALQIIGDRLPVDHRDRRVIRDIRARIGSLNDSVQDLLLFARPRTPFLAPVTLSTVLGDTGGLLAQDATTAGARVELSGEDPVLLADGPMLREAVLNLVLNAAQAMDGVGTVRVHARVDGRSCVLSIVDDGPGVPAGLREKIFEPFFTTRARGTGLGLAIVRRTVEDHGGRIEVRCPDGGGTVMEVRLPIAG